MDQPRLNSVPTEVQQAIDSNNLTEKLLVIGKAYGLTIDQIGRMETLVMSVMKGSTHPNDFVGELESALGLDDDSAVTSIASDINLEVFLPIRQTLMSMHQEGGEEAAAPAPVEDEAHPSRDAILDGIENPTPAVHPFSLASAATGGAAKPIEVIEEKAPQPAPAANARASEAAAQDFILGKLSETMANPAQKVETTPEALAKEPEKPKGYSVDPYREPLI